MQIRTRKLNKSKLTGAESRNLEHVSKFIKVLCNQPKYKYRIGAEVNTLPDGSVMILSAFSSELLSEFIMDLMVETSAIDLEIAFDDKNNENLWSPVWTNRIKLHYVS